MSDFAVRAKQSALLIYDMTKELIDPKAEGYEPWVVEQMSPFRRLIDACRAAGVPVIYALPQTGVDKHGADDPADAICPPIRPAPGDTVLIRPKSGAVADSPLEGLLRQRGRATLLISGMAVDRGCNTAARDAQKLGLRAVVVQDVCFTRDIKEGSFGSIPKLEIQRVHMAALERAGAKIARLEDLVQIFHQS
jgi:maleamate amidohydrolase